MTVHHIRHHHNRADRTHDVVAQVRSTGAFVLALLLLSLPAQQTHAASLQQIGDFGPNPGQLDMHVYVPDGPAPDTMVVALHGCSQEAADFDDETGLTALADTHEFIVLLPEQRPTNHDKSCFRWFSAAHNQPQQGESGSIRNMIRHAVDTFGVDPARIYGLGLSAGGSMTAVLLANYPDVFQAGAIVAGTPYDCNRPTRWTWALWWGHKMWGDDIAASYACGLFWYSPTLRSAEAWGDFVRAAPGTTPTRWPTLSLWQGDADDKVDPANQQELVKQWTDVHGIDQTPDDTDVQNNITHHVYRDANGAPLLETYTIADFNHAIAIDPGPGPAQCGTPADFIEDADICSARKILEFWGVAP